MQTVVIVGAGSFGAWTAHQLARSGCHVTLIDAFGPGNSRASSGGETRVIRMGYGAEEIYTRWSWRSLELWKDLFERTDPTLFRETGSSGDTFVFACGPWLAKLFPDLLGGRIVSTRQEVLYFGPPARRCLKSGRTSLVASLACPSRRWSARRCASTRTRRTATF